MAEIKWDKPPTKDSVGNIGDIYINTKTGRKYILENIYVFKSYDGTVTEYEWDLLPERSNNSEMDTSLISECIDNALKNVGVLPSGDTNITDITQYDRYMGFVTTSGTWSSINEKYQFVIVPVENPGATLTVTANTSQTFYMVGLRSYTEPVNGAYVDFSENQTWGSRLAVSKGNTKVYQIPDDIKYLICFVVYNTHDALPSEFLLTIPSSKGRLDIVEDTLNAIVNEGGVREHTINWLALGDSITEGHYSIINPDTGETEAHKSVDNCYCAWISKIKGYKLDNKGVGGSGWLKRGTTTAPKLNAREQIDALNEDGTYVLDFAKYDICTIMWGVNDWKGSQNLGTFEDGLNPETESVYGNMRYVIETILTRNPNIKLIVITPVNCRQDTSARPSYSSNNWGIGFDFGGHNLEDFYEAIKNVCEYYGVEMIDMLHNSVINRMNAETTLPDKVHPSLEAHKQMGIELAGKILYGG